MSHLGDRCTPGSDPLLLPHGLETCSWQPLDPIPQSYYCSRRVQMNSSHHVQRTLVVLRRHQWVCLFLALLLLYNPFFGVPRPGEGLEVCHPASHRATVGASEMQHFTPMDGWGCFLTADVVQAEVSTPLPIPVPETLAVSVLVVRLPQQFFGPGLWFRPPPAL